MENSKRVLKLLEERIEQHDTLRKEVQSQLQGIHAKMLNDADLLEERLNSEINKNFTRTEERLLDLINKLQMRTGNVSELMEDAYDELCNEPKYEITRDRFSGEGWGPSHILNVTAPKRARCDTPDDTPEHVVALLQEHLDRAHNAVSGARDVLSRIRSERNESIEKMSDRINSDLKKHFKFEDDRLQTLVKKLNDVICKGDVFAESEEGKNAIEKVKVALIKVQKYAIRVPPERCPEYDMPDGYALETSTDAALHAICLSERKPASVVAKVVENGQISLEFVLFSENELEMLCSVGVPLNVVLRVWKRGDSESGPKECTQKYAPSSCGCNLLFSSDVFEQNTEYSFRMKVEYGGVSSLWSDASEFETPEFPKLCSWKRCPDDFNDSRKYMVDEKNPRIVTRHVNSFGGCTVIASTHIPRGAVTTWNVKVLKSGNDNKCDIRIGVAPYDVEQNYTRPIDCGWYLDCNYSTLYSGAPQNFNDVDYADSHRVRDGDSVGVVMDTTKGELSFVLNGMNRGIAYEEIPLDKPLVPCVILTFEGDSVELDTSEVKENEADSSIPVPANIAVKRTTWSTITLAWDAVDGATLYKVEVDGDKVYGYHENSALVEGFLEETEHNFRVRSVVRSKVSEWSDVVTSKTTVKSFETSAWKEYNKNPESCYSVNPENPRVAVRAGMGAVVALGNTPIPLNAVTSWSIKIKKSRGAYIGVVPSDANQDDAWIFNSCGWHFDCYNSELRSGPPHKYDGKEYGPRKWYGQYVSDGGTVGVVMDTTKGDLSFVVDEVNLGVAYEGIPLDKPLVPSALLGYENDSVELII